MTSWKLIFFILYLIICLFIYLLFICLFILLKTKDYIKWVLWYPVLQPAEILASGFRDTRGSDPSGKKVNELSEHVTRCLAGEFYAAIDENHRNFSAERLLCEQVARIWS